MLSSLQDVVLKERFVWASLIAIISRRHSRWLSSHSDGVFLLNPTLFFLGSTVECYRNSCLIWLACWTVDLMISAFLQLTNIMVKYIQASLMLFKFDVWVSKGENFFLNQKLKNWKKHFLGFLVCYGSTGGSV